MTSPVRLLCALAVVAAGAESASAQVEVPKGNIGLVGHMHQNNGAAGDAYRFTWLVGVTAGYEPGRLSNFGIGASWTLAGGQYFSADASLPDARVGVLEMSLGLRLRWLLGETTPRFIVVDAGGTILRTGRAVPPDNERTYLGPYAAVGLDQYVGRRLLLSFALRYGMIAGGPGSFGVRFSLSVGG